MFRFHIPTGHIGIALPRRQHLRLLETCFRGTQIREAGNFNRWANFANMMLDESFTTPLCEVLNDVILERGRPTSSYVERISIPLKMAVGWTSVIPREDAQNAANERRSLNGQSEALFITDKSMLAPQTNIVTLVAEFRIDHVGTLDTLVLIHTLYPGPGTGPLIGDMTEATGFMWFDYHHPGGNHFIEVDP